MNVSPSLSALSTSPLAIAIGTVSGTGDGGEAMPSFAMMLAESGDGAGDPPTLAAASAPAALLPATAIRIPTISVAARQGDAADGTDLPPSIDPAILAALALPMAPRAAAASTTIARTLTRDPQPDTPTDADAQTSAGGDATGQPADQVIATPLSTAVPASLPIAATMIAATPSNDPPPSASSSARADTKSGGEKAPTIVPGSAQAAITPRVSTSSTARAATVTDTVRTSRHPDTALPARVSADLTTPLPSPTDGGAIDAEPISTSLAGPNAQASIAATPPAVDTTAPPPIASGSVPAAATDATTAPVTRAPSAAAATSSIRWSRRPAGATAQPSPSVKTEPSAARPAVNARDTDVAAASGTSTTITPTAAIAPQGVASTTTLPRPIFGEQVDPGAAAPSADAISPPAITPVADGMPIAAPAPGMVNGPAPAITDRPAIPAAATRMTAAATVSPRSSAPSVVGRSFAYDPVVATAVRTAIRGRSAAATVVDDSAAPATVPDGPSMIAPRTIVPFVDVADQPAPLSPGLSAAPAVAPTAAVPTAIVTGTAAPAPSASRGIAPATPVDASSTTPVAAPIAAAPASGVSASAPAPLSTTVPQTAASTQTPAVPLAEPTKPTPPTAAAPASITPQPNGTPPLAQGPAVQVFSAAIAAARRDERSAADDRAIDPATLQPAAATTRAIVTPTGAAQHAPLDMRQDRWPHAMIDRIETLREAAAATGVADTKIRLVPDALGAIDISITRDGDAVSVRFQAEHAATRTLLQESQTKLADIAESRGLRLSGSSVDGGGAGAGSGAGQQQQRAPQQPQPTLPGAPRRTSISDTATADDADSGRVA